MITIDEWYKNLEDRQGKDLQKKLFNAKISIAGLGGLGSNIAILLARCGVGNLNLVDFDKVDLTNINRQMYKISQIGMYKTDATSDNIKDIAPFININTHIEKVVEENINSLFSDSDIIIEAFDDEISKATLVNTVLEIFKEKYIIASSGMAGIKDPNIIKTRKITDKFYLSGDEVSDIKKERTLFAPRVMICASHMALTSVRIIEKNFNI